MVQYTVRCGNCGTPLVPESATVQYAAHAQALAMCPVCHFEYASGEAETLQVRSVGELETRLDELLRSARASGLETNAIVRALRTELAFAAEIGHAGRRFTVQLIDLGPQEGELLRRPRRHPRTATSSRGEA
jgi:hypothetical protein